MTKQTATLPKARKGRITTVTLTVNAWAILSVIRGNPYAVPSKFGSSCGTDMVRYRFVGPERAAAERLVASGLLMRRGKNDYELTALGTRSYEATNTSLKPA